MSSADFTFFAIIIAGLSLAISFILARSLTMKKKALNHFYQIAIDDFEKKHHWTCPACNTSIYGARNYCPKCNFMPE
ncbi:MAG: hypothetical protein WCM76_07950 [Bacteroidota bacterium]|jgi:rubrerythrin